jgi:spore germination protein YaaH
MARPLKAHRLGAVLFFLALIGCEQKGPSVATPPPLQKWGYVIPESFLASDIENRLAAYDVLCIGVYRLNAKGELFKTPSLSKGQRQMLVRLQKKRPLYPLISLRNAREGARMLDDPITAKKAAAALITLLKREGYDGLHIDFEYLTGRHSKAFGSFLRMLKDDPAMRKKTLSIAAFPPLHGKPEEVAFYDLTVLAPIVDEIVYMTYDYHVQKPGPVTHLYWVRQNLDIVRKSFPMKKVWLGVPSYGYEWKGPGRPRAVSEAEGHRQCAKFGCERHDSGMLRVKREDRTVYFSDAELRQNMATIAAQYQTLGTATWRVGFEQ